MRTKIGEVVEAKVISVKPYGAFLSLPSKETGLLHISQISHNFISDVNDFLKVGQIIKVKVIGIDQEKNHIIFSKRVLERPRRRVKSKASYERKHEMIMESKKGFSVLNKYLQKWIYEYKEDKKW